MKELLYSAEHELQNIIITINALTEYATNYPLGSIEVGHSHGHPQFHHYLPTRNPPRKYIKKSEHELASLLAQKEYEQNLLILLNQRKTSLEQLIQTYKSTDLLSSYNNIHPQKQPLIHPLFVSDDDYAKNWQAVQYDRKTFSENSSEIYSNKGERVRSKSEKIIADLLYQMDIPYRYEFPFLTITNRLLHPDFLILNKRTRKEYYLEHFGRMEDPEYVSKNINRMNELASSGLILGQNLLFTFESAHRPLNTKTLQLLVETHFL